MANWCTNSVTVVGDEDRVKLLMEEIKALQREYEEKGLGVRPGDGGNLTYMFDLYIDEDYFSFESRWFPALDSLKYLAKKHKVTITNDYCQLGDNIYGQWCGTKDRELDIYLTNEEIDLVVRSEDEDETFYIYKEEKFECKEDALDLILKEKIKDFKS